MLVNDTFFSGGEKRLIEQGCLIAQNWAPQPSYPNFPPSGIVGGNCDTTLARQRFIQLYPAYAMSVAAACSACSTDYCNSAWRTSGQYGVLIVLAVLLLRHVKIF